MVHQVNDSRHSAVSNWCGRSKNAIPIIMAALDTPQASMTWPIGQGCHDETLPHGFLHPIDWTARWKTWCAYGGSPWWGKGLVISPELRGRYEMYLPVSEYVATLRRVAASFLPHASWMPRSLYEGNGRAVIWQSLPDLWASLPEDLGGRVCFPMAQCISLFCALADPPRFGTDTDRYPEQMETLRGLFRKWPRNRPLRLLDIGCGVGLNTLEILSLASAEGVQVHAMGLTAEPLEAWMAQTRQLPHDPRRQRRLQAFPDFSVTFCCGDARNFQIPEPVDIMICNGLAGGRFLYGEEDLLRFLTCCRRQLAPHGCLLMANHFHDGFRPALDNLMQRATATGWILLHDNPHHLVLG